MAFLIYLVCLGVGLVFTLVTAVAGHIFGSHDGVEGSHGHAEAGADGSDMPGVSAFSPVVLASFITAFGGLGVIFTQIPFTSSPWVSAPLAIVGALVIAGALLQMLKKLFHHTQSSSESKVSSLVGQSATTVSSIPENGVGEIAYVQAGTRYTAPAREMTGIAIQPGQSVKIMKVIGTQFYVTIA